MSLVGYEKHGTVAVLTVNNPPVNAMSPGVPKGICEGVAQANADDTVSAIVLIGGGRGFIAGADIRYFSLPWPDGEESFADIIAAFEASPKPVIAAIHGHALGGGLETAMACHYRVIVPTANVGQPEVKLGFPPGAGGTQRLPRLAGLSDALDMIVSGNPVKAPKAAAMGIVDQVIDGDLLEGALAFATEKGAQGGDHRRTRDIELTLDDPGIFEAKRKEIARRARGMRAPFACIECVEAAVELEFDAGVKREREIFKECVKSEESVAMRHVFFAERAANKIPGISKDVKPRTIAKAGVLGAGTMGGGIAMNFVNAGIPVTIIEQSQEALDRGMGIIAKNYAATVAKGRMSQEQMDACLGAITPTTSMDDLADADMIIEAVFETMAVKKEVFTKLDAVAKPDAILTSNTSYLDINEIAEAIPGRNGHVLGTHFFSPANVMRLVEVVRTDNVSDENLVTTMDIGRRMRKLPIVTGVCHGFIGNRMLEGYFGEASIMVEQGAKPLQIDTVMFGYGMAMGPLAVMDLAGLDIGWSKRKDAGGGTAADSVGAFVSNRLCEMGRYGQKTKRGYYIYEDGSRRPVPDAEVDQLAADAAAHFGFEHRAFKDQEILERCLYPLVNIGADILAEGHALRASDIDLVYLNGYGFPGWRGGPMHWAGTVGLDKVYEAVCRYHETLGFDHWKPSPLLKKLAEEGKTFDDYDKNNAG
ncbi:MAG: 3-hydroxyacyl-CoA dehydrogenase [Rhodospirillaceae bacterium]|jgi:3-hydroxyacyl-CoA dehydrogenase|nr:3-hydroxyacyl-CoA dehydrogenase [Rhodospirillaceae bacterium]MBT6511657.1 3-hydroxyacyl-CoA dehydrogenase [Rhodospirillaceae bacterium]MBT7646040.1 3-hydroxyacyl-CoA dehydrogenase [Rhodospirillaceae bacterium]